MFEPRTFVVPLYGGDYQQRIALAEQKVEEVEDRIALAEKREKEGKVPPRLMGEKGTEVDALRAERDDRVAEHNALVDQAESDGCTRVTLRALGRRRWNDLVKAHPPRTGNDVAEDVRKSDETIGVNDETFGEALLLQSIEGIPDGTSLNDLLDLISSAQFDLLYRTAFALNRDGGPSPKALTPSLSTAATES